MEAGEIGLDIDVTLSATAVGGKTFASHISFRKRDQRLRAFGRCCPRAVSREDEWGICVELEDPKVARIALVVERLWIMPVCRRSKRIISQRIFDGRDVPKPAWRGVGKTSLDDGAVGSKLMEDVLLLRYLSGGVSKSSSGPR